MNDVDSRLAELARDHDLPAEAVTRLAALLDFVAGDSTAPTTVADPPRAVDVHVADSLDALVLPDLARAGFIADIGAGAGFPGLALAAALPDTTVALVESVGRKCEFIERAAGAAGIANARAVHARAEEWPDGIGRCDVVTARALAPLGVLIEYAGPLLREAGALVAWKGRMDRGEAADAAAASSELGLEPREVIAQPRRSGADEHSLYVYVKVRATPERFPRRAGMARKRPITG